MVHESNQNNVTSQGPKKRVLFIITQSEMGGAQRFIYGAVSRLNRDKYDISVAIGNTGNGELNLKLAPLGIEVFKLKYLTRSISPINDLRAVFEIKNLIKDWKPQTVFLNSSKAGFIGSLAASYELQATRPKVIYRIGGWTFNDPWPTWKKKLWVNLEKMSAGWKDIIIVNNEHDLLQARQLKIKPRQGLVLIHNGIDIYKMDLLPREEARLKLFEKISRYSGKIFQAKTIIGAIANFYPAKGLDVLIKSAEHFRNNGAVFFIIGDGPLRPGLEKLIKEKGLEHTVFLLGQIPDAKQYLSAFDMLVLPSLKEGFPWALIEAMAARLPVVATSVGAVPEIIENGKNGFIVDPGKPAQLAAKIKEILNSDHLQKEFAIQAHQTILFKFSEDKMIKEIESLI